MKKLTIPELEAALDTATEKVALLLQKAEAADRHANGILGTDPAVASGIRRKPSPRADAQRRSAYDRAADLWLAHAAAARDRDALERLLKRARRDAAAPRDLASLRPGSLVRTHLGWHRVVRVNRTSVSVETGYSWTDLIRLDRIIETRNPA